MTPLQKAIQDVKHNGGNNMHETRKAWNKAVDECLEIIRQHESQQAMDEEALRLLKCIEDAVSGYLVEHERVAEGNDQPGYSLRVWGSDRANLVAASKSHIPLLRERLRAQQPAGWQPIETAPKDGRRVLVKFKDDLSQYEGMGPGSLERWQGLPFVGRHRGDVMEWAFAAPVGHGGFPDAWLDEWKPISTEVEGEKP